MRLGQFFSNAEYGKNRERLTDELAEVTVETRKRTVNGLTTDDQRSREDNLREVRGRIN
jgi:hypothetical protein